MLVESAVREHAPEVRLGVRVVCQDRAVAVLPGQGDGPADATALSFHGRDDPPGRFRMSGAYGGLDQVREHREGDEVIGSRRTPVHQAHQLRERLP
ncbi:hypothetical protein [Nonomuraea sp. NPDC005650]|uniref:hypothetical protein n=1 Tax=Nonomuraea sp. NPDC005650 TaxID=3157045 RepID=UPI0033B8F126